MGITLMFSLGFQVEPVMMIEDIIFAGTFLVIFSLISALALGSVRKLYRML